MIFLIVWHNVTWLFNISLVRFAVFALGSSAYPNFCSFGKFLDNVLGELGGERLMKIVLGDDLCGQEQEFRKWTHEIFKTSCEAFCLDMSGVTEIPTFTTLTNENTRFQVVKDFNEPLSATLSKYHNKVVRACKVKNKPINLHGTETSERSTVLVELNIDSVSEIFTRKFLTQFTFHILTHQAEFEIWTWGPCRRMSYESRWTRWWNNRKVEWSCGSKRTFTIADFEWKDHPEW